MEKNEYEKLYNIAKELNEKEKYEDAIEILKKLKDEILATSDINYNFLYASSLIEIDLYNEALYFFNKAIKIDEKSEIASLGLYITWIKMNRSEKAIEEMKRYLDKYPADLYKTTLGELLDDINNGYAIDFKETILELAEKNHIHHPQ